MFKKLEFTIGVGAFILVFILSSCAVQKRKYRNGFYVDFFQHKKELKSTPPKKTELAKNTTKKVDDAKAQTKTELSHQDEFIVAEHSHLSASNDKKATPLINATKKKLVEVSHRLHDKKEAAEKHTKDETPDQVKKHDKSKRIWAIITGVSILLLAIAAAVTVISLGELFILGDVALTALNVTSNFGKYLTMALGWVFMLLMDVLISLGIYNYHKKEEPKKKKKATVTALLRLIYSSIFGIGIFNLLTVTSASSAATIYNQIRLFHKFWELGLIVFGFHLIALGILYDNEKGKKWVKYTIKSLLIIAGLAYITIYAGILFVPNPVAFKALIESIFVVPMVLSEISYAIWKLVKGGRKTHTQP